MHKILFLFLFLFSKTLSAQNKEWTILVYLSADNNLSNYMSNILRRLQKVGASDEINLLVQFDGDKKNDSKRLQITKKQSVIYAENLEYDMGRPETLVDFVEWGRKMFPANHYALLVSAHGRGILNVKVDDGSFVGTDAITLASSPDDSSHSFMNEEDLANQLSNSLGGDRIDLLIYNSCLMGNFEVLQAFSSIADYAIASIFPITIRDDSSELFLKEKEVGVPFERIIAALNQNSQLLPEALGKISIETWRDSYKDFFYLNIHTGQKVHVEATLALYDLSKVSNIEILLKNFSNKLVNLAISDPTTFDQIFIELLKLPPVYGDNYFDMTMFFQTINKVLPLPETSELLNILNGDSFILDRSITHANALAALSMFFPSGTVIEGNEGLIDALNFYSRLELAQRTSWYLLVSKYLELIKERKIQIILKQVKSLLKTGEIIQLTNSNDPNYNEYYLFLMAEISFYPLVERGDYRLLQQYIQLIASSEYSSVNFNRHKIEMKSFLQRLFDSENSTEYKPLIQFLINLLN